MGWNTQGEKCAKVYLKNQEERHHLQDAELGSRMILKQSLNK
jgi:hypothetical protein